jgi:hypothetical protein
VVRDMNHKLSSGPVLILSFLLQFWSRFSSWQTPFLFVPTSFFELFSIVNFSRMKLSASCLTPKLEDQALSL